MHHALKLLIILCLSLAAKSFAQAPAIPDGASVWWVDDEAEVTSGEGWLTQTNFASQSYHLNGDATLRIPLKAVAPASGKYRLGLVLRTGTMWDAPTGQLENYRLSLNHDGAITELGQPVRVDGQAFAPMRDAGQPDAWANWYGTVQATQPVELAPDDSLIVENLAKHGGVLAVWTLPLQGADAITLSIQTGVPLNAFIAGQTPTLKVAADLPAGQPTWRGFLRIDEYDLLTDQSRIGFTPVELSRNAPWRYELHVSSKPGVYKVTIGLVNQRGAHWSDGQTTASTLYAYSPAKRPADLPDDWPLGAHVDVNLPVMPGFKWFRYFAPWHDINPAPGVYEWADFDQIFAEVKASGGKLMIAGDGSPVWTSKRGKAGMPWAANATAYPPDDWAMLRNYLEAMLTRYRDPANTLAALELCNEANTHERWLGSDEELVTMAKVFREAIAATKSQAKLIGIAVSAGHQQPYVEASIDAGILERVDIVSGHWYEELMSYEIETPHNSLPRHVQLLEAPMKDRGVMRPIINSESGIRFVPRQQDKLISQAELNAAAEAAPDKNARDPWIDADGMWRAVSERRAAASYVTGTVALMGLGVEQSFYFNYLDFIIEGTPSLPWVALGQLGHYLEPVNYRQVEALPAEVVGSSGEHGQPKALAYRFGNKTGKQLIVVWAYLSDQEIGRSKHWQPWLEPVKVRITSGPASGNANDLYARTTTRVSASHGELEIMVGEEPVFIELN